MGRALQSCSGKQAALRGMAARPGRRMDAREQLRTAGRIDSDLANQIKDAVHSLEHIKVTDLMALLARIHVD